MSCCETHLEFQTSYEFYKNFFMDLDGNLITIVFWISKRWKADRSVVLMAGLSGSGKTLIFSQLLCGEDKETLTSLKENHAVYSVGEKSDHLTLVDIPGSESIRNSFLEKYKQKI